MTTQEWIDLISGLDIPEPEKKALTQVVEQGGITGITLSQANLLSTALVQNVEEIEKEERTLSLKKHQVDEQGKRNQAQLRSKLEELNEKGIKKLNEVFAEISETLGKIDAEEATKEEHFRKTKEVDQIKTIMSKIRSKKLGQ